MTVMNTTKKPEKALRFILTVMYTGIVFVSVFFLLFGVISFFSTLALYSTLGLVIFAIINFLPEKLISTSVKLNLKVACFSLLLMLCITDFTLRYLIKPSKYLDRNENNGGWCYSSYPLRMKFRFITNRIYNFERERGFLYTNPPNKIKTITNNEFSYEHRYNSEGLRNKEISTTKQQNEIRIITLGDSYTEGVGSPQDSTCPCLFEQELQRCYSKDSFYTVINAGVYGSDPFFESYLLKTRLLRYKPDIVFVAINNSDITDVIERGGFERFASDSTIVFKNSAWWEPLSGASIIVRMAVRNIFKYGNNFLRRKDFLPVYLEASKSLVIAVNEMAKMAKEAGFKLVIIFNPSLNEMGASRFDLDVTKRLIVDSTINIIDLQRDYNNYFKQNNLNYKDYFWPKDSHPNSKGYLIWSRILLSEMREKKTLKDVLVTPYKKRKDK